MPLVLAHNDVVANPAHQWDDVEGVHYHYPSKYRGKVRTGEPFVYYRGTYRVNGGRGPAEYVGSGFIGAIWADSERRNAWYCGIDVYERFHSPVPAKVDGVNRENIPANLWRDGVRALDSRVYEEIVNEGSAGPTAPIAGQQHSLAELQNVILPPALAKHHGAPYGYRRSHRSKEVGDWAEQTALEYIESQIAGCTDCTHRAALGETPGWDIDYRDGQGLLQRVEVKRTVGAALAAVEFTANEFAAAEEHADQYWLFLIAECETDRPKIQRIQNPAQKIASGQWAADPMLYTVRFSPN